MCDVEPIYLLWLCPQGAGRQAGRQGLEWIGLWQDINMFIFVLIWQQHSFSNVPCKNYLCESSRRGLDMFF